MKKHITITQLKELSKKGKEKLRTWWTPAENDFIYNPDKKELGYFTSYGLGYLKKNLLPVLSIGQMIELLDSFWSDLSIDHVGEEEWHVYNEANDIKVYSGKDLRNALWEAVKETL